MRALSDRLQLEIAAELADDPAEYDQPLAQASQRVAELLAPAVLDPANVDNVLLALEKGYADALAELERAGYSTAELSVFAFWHKYDYLDKNRSKG